MLKRCLWVGTAVVDGVVYLTSCFPENVALIGCSELSQLTSWFGLHTLPNKRFFHVPVLLKNETYADIVISPKTVLAEMYSVQQVWKSLRRVTHRKSWQNRQSHI